jgi:hypothetical protein
MKQPLFIGRNGPLITVLVVACAALLAACAGNPPTAEMAVGGAAVERATGPAAADAPVEMATARDKLARATTAYANKDYALARQLANEADADATLAEAQARSARSTRALAEVRDGIRMLRDEAARK